MTGKKRFAAKLGVLTAVLAAGGGGTYFYTSGGGAPWRNAGDTPSLSQVSASAERSDLDAVASAWAASAMPPRQSLNDASPTARSADGGPTAAESEPNSAAISARSTDRYRRYSENSSSRGEALADAPVGDDSAASDQIVRGQDQGAAPSQKATGESTAPSGGDSNNPGGGEFLVLPTDDNGSAEQNSSGAAQRAREAFSDQPPATAAAGRYGQATPAPRVAQPAAAQSAAGQPRAVNSAAAQAGAPQSGASQTGAANNVPQVNPFVTGRTTQPPAASGVRPADVQLAREVPTTAGAGRSPEPAMPAGSGEFRPLRDDGNTSSISGLPPSAYPSNVGEPAGLSPVNAAAPSGTGSLQSRRDVAGALSAGFAGSAGETPLATEGNGRPGERALEGPQSPSIMIQKLAPAEIQVGKPAKFAIQIRNVGGQAATDVVIRDEVPHGTRLINTTPAAESAGGQLLWKLGTLSTGEQRTIEMQLMPISEGDVGSVATVSYSAQVSVKTKSTMPQLAIRMTAAKQVMIGQQQRVKIELHNPGSGDATGVMLFENVPENLKHEAGAALEFEIGTLRAGETRELELVMVAEKAGKVVNILSARAEGNLQVQQQVEFDVIAPALTVAVSGPERRYLERPAAYQVIVENPGTAPARDVQLVTRLPKGMKFVRANNMGEYDPATHAIYWSLAELPEGEKTSVEVVAMPVEAGTQSLEVEGRAQQGLSDRTKQQILVEGLAAIMFEVRDLEDPIEVGKETAYEIRVVNQGTKAAQNVQIAVALPQGMQLVAAEGETRHTAQQGGVIFAPLRELAPKADSVFRLRVQCARPGDQRVTVEVKTDDLAQPIRREESTRVFGDE